LTWARAILTPGTTELEREAERGLGHDVGVARIDEVLDEAELAAEAELHVRREGVPHSEEGMPRQAPLLLQLDAGVVVRQALPEGRRRVEDLVGDEDRIGAALERVGRDQPLVGHPAVERGEGPADAAADLDGPALLRVEDVQRAEVEERDAHVVRLLVRGEARDEDVLAELREVRRVDDRRVRGEVGVGIRDLGGHVLDRDLEAPGVAGEPRVAEAEDRGVGEIHLQRRERRVRARARLARDGCGEDALVTHRAAEVVSGHELEPVAALPDSAQGALVGGRGGRVVGRRQLGLGGSGRGFR
jgi:hypothetical protein